MPSAFFLAQTAAEFQQVLPPVAQKAWMACHFSPYGTGLSNLPSQLPAGSMLIVNDRTPVAGHDPQKIVWQLEQLAEEHAISRILLDFQRSGEARTEAIAKAIVQALPCPVGVSSHYAAGLDCPVFLPPLPLHMPPAAYFAPWSNRRIWLEIAPLCAVYTVTESGCAQAVCEESGHFPHFDEQAICRYRIELQSDAACFTLCRGLEELALLRQNGAADCFVGLYQDFAQPDAQETAFDQ